MFLAIGREAPGLAVAVGSATVGGEGREAAGREQGMAGWRLGGSKGDTRAEGGVGGRVCLRLELELGGIASGYVDIIVD